MLEKHGNYPVGTKVCEETSKQTRLVIPIEMTQYSMNGQSCVMPKEHTRKLFQWNQYHTETVLWYKEKTCIVSLFSSMNIL
jgi:hypothetical protein